MLIAGFKKPEQTIPAGGARPTAAATVTRLAIAAVGASVGAQSSPTSPA